MRDKKGEGMKKFLVEFLGTFSFILTILATQNPVASAVMLMMWVYIGAGSSGSHYNPAVSLAIALYGRLSWKKLPGYMIAQVLGGFCAYAFTFLMQGAVAISHPGFNVGLLQAFVVEVYLAALLVLVILTIVFSEKYKNNTDFGFAIGFTIPALAALGTPISGGLFNPAIALGGMLWSWLRAIPVIYSHIAMYVGGAFLGAILATHLYNYLENRSVYDHQVK